MVATHFIRYSRGFNLLELMIALAITAILISLAYPRYTAHVARSHRIEAQTALQDLAMRMEHYYAEHHYSYAGATLVNLNKPETTANALYKLAVTQATDTHYSLQAAPLGKQATQDKHCGSLTLNDLGERGQTGTGTVQECWR